MNKRNIFIGGVARSGKSTIAAKLCQNSIYNHFPVDYIATSFTNHFPGCGINNKVIINKTSVNLSLFLSTVIESMNKTYEKFIVDSAHVMPRDIIQYLDRDKWDIYFVGYPNISPEVKLNNLRTYDGAKSWTRKYDDKAMTELVKGLINISKEIEEECLKYNIKFINTSYNFLDIIAKSVAELK